MTQDKTYGSDPDEPLGLSREQRTQSELNEALALLHGGATLPKVLEVPLSRRTMRNIAEQDRRIT